MKETEIWKIIEIFFRDSPDYLMKHHIGPFEKFYKVDIYDILKKHNPIRICTKDTKSQCNLYIGGKEGNQLYFGKPIVYDGQGNDHFMFPNEARLLNLTYEMSLYYDMEIEIIHCLEEGEELSLESNEFIKQLHDGQIDIIDTSLNIKRYPISDLNQIQTTTQIAEKIQKERNESYITEKDGTRKQTYNHKIEKIFLGNFPIMLQSKFCILYGLSYENRIMMGECKNDSGGYFIIDGKEKYISHQEILAENILVVKNQNQNQKENQKEKEKEEDNDEDNDEDKIEKDELNFIYSSEINAVENEKGGAYVIGGTDHNVTIFLTLQTGIFYTKEAIVLFIHYNTT